LSSSTVIEFVRITVLVVDGSTVVAFGTEGIGLESWAGSADGPAMQAAAIKAKVQVFIRLQGFPF
jgi:hypothetical protein